MTNIKVNLKISDILFTITMIFVLAFPGPSVFKAISIIAFFCYMMVMKAIRYRKIKNNLHIIGSFLFLGYAYISRMWALYPEAVFVQLNNVIWTVLLSTAVSSYVLHRNLRVKDITNRLIPIALVFLVNVLFNASFVDNRLSIGINENFFGRLSGGMACFMFYQCKQDKWKNIFRDILAGILILLTFLSGSRTAVLILTIYVIAFLIFEHPPKNGIKVLRKLLLVVAFCGIGYFCIMKIDFLYNTIGNRIESLLWMLEGTSEGDGSAITRMNMINSARDLFLEHPWIGIGMNNFSYATYYNTYAHNNYYELAACLGIIGLILYYVPLVGYLKKAMSEWKKDGAGMIVPLVIVGAFLMGDVGSVSYFNPMLHVFVGLAIGLIINAGNQKASY